MPRLVTKRLIALVAVAVGAGVLLAHYVERPVVSLLPATPSPAATPRRPVRLPPPLPDVAHAAPVVPTLLREQQVGESADAFEARQRVLARFDRWTEEAAVTPEQVTQTLRVLADAQVAYQAAARARVYQRLDAELQTEMRMNSDQRARLDAALAKSRDPDPAVSGEGFRAMDALNAELAASAPDGEREMYEASREMERGEVIEDDAYEAMGQFLTSAQLNALKQEFPWFDNLVDDPIVATR